MVTVAPTEHRSRLLRGAVELLRTQRVAALATLEAEGSPFVSMVPFALEPGQVPDSFSLPLPMLHVIVKSSADVVVQSP